MKKMNTYNQSDQRVKGVSKCMHGLRVIVLAACLSVGLGTASSQTNPCVTTVPAGFVANQTWTAANSPYCITGDVQLALLTIEPGVEVLVDGPYSIEVLTTINAVGTESHPIIFTAKDPAVRWKGMRFQDTPPGSVLAYCQLSYASESALQIIESADIEIRNCSFANSVSSIGGGGVHISQTLGDATLVNCIVEANGSAGSHGGGVHAVMGSGTLRLQGCSIQGNWTSVSGYQNLVGGGVRVSGDSELINCLILNNACYGYQFGDPLSRGGGIYTDSGDAVFRGCTIRGNTAKVRAAGGVWATFAHGGGLYVASGSVILQNCIVAENKTLVTKGTTSQHRGGGIYVHSGALVVENDTIVNNDWHGIYRAGGGVGVTNSILFFNNNDGAQYGGTIAFDYSCIQGWANGADSNIGYNPALCPNNFSLLTGSLCIDAGHPDPQYEEPYTDETVCSPFPRGTSRNDIGAFGGPGAYIGAGVEPSILEVPISQSSCLEQTASFAVTATSPLPLSYQWYFNDAVLIGETNTALFLMNLQSTNAGTYKVVASNGAGVAEASAQLIVYDACIGIEVVTFFDMYKFAGLSMQGCDGCTYVLSYTTDLGNPASWIPVETNVMNPTGWFFLDLDSVMDSQRFYKAELVP